MRKRKKVFVGLIALVIIAGVIALSYKMIRAATLSVSDTFDNPLQIASKSNMTICGGQVKLAEDTWTTLSECTCNSISGWYWITTNSRSACWSKTLADSVSWNKGAGNDSGNPGTYTCATDITALKDRMSAVSAGEWYKIVSDVNGTSITSSHNGASGYSVISALAISDCLDGLRDICSGDGCLGANETDINVSLRAWAIATGGKSALPYCASSSCDTAVNNDYRSACEATPNQDYPLACYATNVFYQNWKTCSSDVNYIWAASAANTPNAYYLGGSSCSYAYGYNNTSLTGINSGFRVVLRP